MQNHYLSRILLRRFETEKGKNNYINITQKTSKYIIFLLLTCQAAMQHLLT